MENLSQKRIFSWNIRRFSALNVLNLDQAIKIYINNMPIGSHRYNDVPAGLPSWFMNPTKLKGLNLESLHPNSAEFN